MKYGVLGALTVTGSEPLVLRPRERSIVALLVINRNHVLSTSRIVDELWSSQPPESANNLVQQYVSRIRGQLRDRGDDAAAESLRTCGPGYLLSCDDADLDSACFESMLDDARDALAKRRHEAAVRLLSDGLRMWRGAPFLDVQGMPAVAAEVCRLEEQRLRAIEERLDAELALGRHTGLVSELTQLPSCIGDFTGRSREVAHGCEVLRGDRRRAGGDPCPS